MRRPLAVAVAALLALIVGCSSAGAAPAWAEPWPQRPEVSLAFDVAPDLRGVTGREQVTFTPDLPICELVFRAWPNAPYPAGEGSALRVTDAAVDGRPTAPRVEAGGAPAGVPGTLVTLPLPQCSPAGRTVTADLGFTVTLGVDADDRLGTSPSTGTAWFGTAYPMLAWVRGQGWSRTPAGSVPAENAVGETYRLRSLDVTAPEGLAVAGAGQAAGAVPGPRPGTTVHRFGADAVRDVTVAVGRYRVTEREVGDGVQLHLLTPVGGTRTSVEQWGEQIDTAVRRLTPLFGPFPARDLWVAIAPSQTSGIEYPGAVQFGDTALRDVESLATHELAHQWFYALVGNDQGAHPWVDEAFATYADAVATGRPDAYGLDDVPERLRGRLGDPVTAGDRGGAYETGVYVQGAAVLLEARRRVGAPAFDDAVRAYVAANAHRVAAPSDVAAAFAGLPPVVELLTDAGALAPTR